MDEYLGEKVLRWLERTGFPLEMRVAEEARRAQPQWVDQSRNFVDPVSGKIRETDVVAGWADQDRRGGAYVYLVLECKAKPAPWVIFDDGELMTDDAELRLAWTARRSAPDDLGNTQAPTIRSGAFVGGTLFKPSRVGFGVIEATFNDPKPQERNGAWDAVRSAVSAAHGVLNEFDPGQIERTSVALLAVPVVVTSGRLFRAYLQRGETNVEEIDRGEVLVRPGSELDQTRCMIVTETALPGLLDEARATPALIVNGD